MIDRFQVIKNIGRFRDCAMPDRDTFRRVSLIYAENGKGKTTLSAILRSLRTGSPGVISERRRLGAEGASLAVVSLDSGGRVARYDGSRWTMVCEDLFLFDDAFVHENIYSGLRVEAGHRQGLHELIIGRDGVALARRIEELGARSAEIQTRIRAIEAQVTPVERGLFTVDAFCGLAERANIEAEIAALQGRIVVQEQSQAVMAGELFEALQAPAINLPELENLLAKGLAEVEAEALAAVRHHLDELGADSESWVAVGMTYVRPERDARCPFCDLALELSPLLQHYRAYFGAAYAAHKSEVERAKARILEGFGEDGLLAIQRQIELTRQRHALWTQFVPLPGLAIEERGFVTLWKAARDTAAGLLGQKVAAPLEEFAMLEDSSRALEEFAAEAEALTAVGTTLTAHNEAIRKLKAEAAGADANALARELTALRATKARYTPAIRTLCEDYLAAKREKDAVELERGDARAQLDVHRAAVIPRYQASVNALLGRFGAEFQIAEMEATNPRPRPSSAYCIRINAREVPVRGGEPAAGTPSFGSALSSGDRNTLALAFFFATLELDARLAAAIVVVDDPITSLDDARCLATAQEIRRLMARAKQTIVLSHSKSLLCAIWNSAPGDARSAHAVVGSPDGSLIERWDVSDQALTEFDRNHSTLREYLSTGRGFSREAAAALRPTVEGFLRVSCAAHYPPGKKLGAFINEAMRALAEGTPLLLDSKLEELRNINEYACLFHHPETEGVPATPAPESEEQLRTWVRRVLAFTEVLKG